MNRHGRPPTLVAQTLEFDAAGRAWSTRYGDVYASRDGALGQARHVFLGGNDLPRAWAGRRHFTIVETGFGLGNNFLATWAAWCADPQRPLRLHFVSLEAHPLRAIDLRQLAEATHADVQEQALQPLRSALARAWPEPLAGLHRLEFEGGAVVLTLALGGAEDLAADLQLGADAYYLDGFAPERNPEMWTPKLIKALARLARPGATAATYSSARVVREALVANGFAIEAVPGFATKRTMLRARYAPRWQMRRHEPPPPYAGSREAIVVGAGLAGCACAAALAARGWQVQLLDRAGIGAGASGLPSGLLTPLLSVDDNLASRLVRAGYHYSLACLRRVAPAQIPVWAPCGVFDVAADEEQEAQWRAMVQEHGWPESYAVARTAQAGSADLGVAPRRGGLWFGQGAVVAPARWCAAMIEPWRADGPDRGGAAAQAAQAGAIAFDSGFEATALRRVDATWEVQGRSGDARRAAVLVLANAAGLTALHELPAVALQAVGGRLTLLQAPAFAGLGSAIGGDGYLIPPLLGPAAIGATYEVDTRRVANMLRPNPPALAPDPHLAETAAQQENLRRLARLLEVVPSVQTGGSFAGQRCVAPDRLPLAGQLVDEAHVQAAAARLRGAQLRELPRCAGLYALAALGSRGLALAPLLAELVAAQICGEPAPIEASLVAAVDPGRYTLRGLR